MVYGKTLSLAVIEKAVSGDILAMEEVMKHFSGYIAYLAKRDFIDEEGNVHSFVDDTVYADLQAFLVEKVLVFDLGIRDY